MLCVELLAESRLLQHDLPREELEGAVISIADAGHAAKAAQELMLMAEAVGRPSADTLAHVMQALSRDKEADTAAALLEACADELSAESSHSYNSLMRAYARSDREEQAVALFGRLFKADLLEGSAFTTMASMHLRLGNADAADDMLELRD